MLESCFEQKYIKFLYSNISFALFIQASFFPLSNLYSPGGKFPRKFSEIEDFKEFVAQGSPELSKRLSCLSVQPEISHKLLCIHTAPQHLLIKVLSQLWRWSKPLSQSCWEAGSCQVMLQAQENQIILNQVLNADPTLCLLYPSHFPLDDANFYIQQSNICKRHINYCRYAEFTETTFLSNKAVSLDFFFLLLLKATLVTHLAGEKNPNKHLFTCSISLFIFLHCMNLALVIPVHILQRQRSIKSLWFKLTHLLPLQHRISISISNSSSKSILELNPNHDFASFCFCM